MTDRIDCNETTPLIIIEQGAIVLEDNPATVVHRSERMAVVSVECRSKYARMRAATNIESGDEWFELVFDSDEHTIKRHSMLTGWTVVRIPEFEEWTVEGVLEGGRYSHRVLLVKRDSDADRS